MKESKQTILHKLINYDIQSKTAVGITSESIREELIDFLMLEV